MENIENKPIKALIREIKFKKGLIQKQIAVEIGVAPTYLSDVINGKVPFTKSIRTKLLEHYSDCFDTEITPQKYYGGANHTDILPLIQIDAVAGFPTTQMDGVLFADCEHYNVPEFVAKGAQYLIRVSGSSMYPKYSNGDILACRKIEEITFFQWGKVYVLDTNQGALVKRLFEDVNNPDNIICHSDNSENYPNFSIPKSEIRSLSIVIGVIRLD